MKVGGPADQLYVPESENELIGIYAEMLQTDSNFVVLGRGSNTIFGDAGFRGTIVKTTKACRDFIVRGSKRKLFSRLVDVEVGASLPNTTFLRLCAENELAGPAYLQSVPGNIGGSIAMNAGTGIDEGQSISDDLISLKVFDGERVAYLPKEACDFSFRYSTFQKKKWLVLGAIFRFRSESKEVVQKRISARMEFAKKWQDLGYPNAGSVFKSGYQHIEGLQGKKIGNAMYSKKSANWIINLGKASAGDILSLVEWGKKAHEKQGYDPPELEWCVY